MKEWRFVGLCLLLGGLIFFSLNQFAKALQPEMTLLDGDLGGWEIEAMAVDFHVIETIDKENAWALQDGDNLPDRIYRYDGDKWQIDHIFGPSERMAGLDMVSVTDGWAFGKTAVTGTGGTGTLWRYDGRSWNRFTMPVEQHIFGLDMISAEEGWALGSDALLKYDGVKWEEVGLGLTLSNRNDIRYYLKVFSETEAWVYYNSSYNGDYGSIYFYDGIQWQQVPNLPTVVSLAMISSTNGWASTQYNLFHYDGTQWSQVLDPPFRNMFGPVFREFSVVSPDNIWATTWGTLYHYDGAEWSTILLPEDIGGPKEISVAEEGGWIMNGDGRMIEYADNEWLVREDPIQPIHLTHNDLNEVRVVSHDITLIDDKRHLYNDNWETPTLHPDLTNFIAQTSRAEIITPTAISLERFDVSPPGEAWAIGSIDYTYLRGSPPHSRESNAQISDVLFELEGTLWKPITTTISSYFFDYFSAFDMLSDQSGWVVSTYNTWEEGPIKRYDGNSWQHYPFPDTFLNDIQMLSEESGWAVGGSTRMLGTIGLRYRYSAILQFDGTEWKTVENTPGYELYAIDMLSETEGWAVGAEGTILHYVDGNWLLEPSPIETRLSDIDMISPDEGWAIGLDTYNVVGREPSVYRSTILHYNGDSWQIAGTLENFRLRSISVLDSDTGRIVGDDGLILKLSEQVEPTPTPEPTSTPTMTSTVTSTVTPLSTFTPTATPSPTDVPPTTTATNTPIQIPTSLPTFTPMDTAIPTATSTPTIRPTITSTPTTIPTTPPTAIPAPTEIPPTETPLPTPTATSVPTTTPLLPTLTPTSLPTEIPPTETLLPTSTATSSPTATLLPPTPTLTPTATPSPTDVPPTSTPFPTTTATSVPTATRIPPTFTLTPTATPSPTDVPPTSTPQPTLAATAMPTATPIPPTSTSTVTVIALPTAISPTATATLIPTSTSVPVVTEVPNVVGKSEEYLIYLPVIAQ